MHIGKVHRRETFVTTLHLGDGRRIDINRTIIVGYPSELTCIPDEAHLENDPHLVFEGFTPEQEQEFRDLFDARTEPGFMDRFTKFVEKMRVYRPNVIGDL